VSADTHAPSKDSEIAIPTMTSRTQKNVLQPLAQLLFG